MAGSSRTPQWDDWRCYRCQRWFPSRTVRATAITPAGFPVALCRMCAVRHYAERDHGTEGCSVCEWRVEQQVGLQGP